MKQTYDDRNQDLQVWINGKLTHRDAAAISPFDSPCRTATPSGKGCGSTTGASSS